MSKLKKILVDSFAMTESEFTDQQSVMQLKDFDSMNHMLFITKLEDAYNIELTGDEIAMMQTVGDVKKILQQKGK